MESVQQDKSVLLVDDNREFVQSTHDILKMIGYSVDYAYELAEAKQKLKKGRYSHLLLDLMLPDGSGINVLDEIKPEVLSSMSITIITGHPAVKTVVKSLYGPNVNYLVKPITFKKLQATLNQEPKERDYPEESQQINRPLEQGQLIGESSAIAKLQEDINLVAASSANVMILGESGVGKEVIAQEIHARSQVRGPIVSTNCGALSRELVTSELFGHEKGAFTGAVSRKVGVFEKANGGTLFLDEVTEMPLELQPNLLRVLETQQVTRLGGENSLPARCRVISASNRSEAEFAKKEYLREDLYYRLAVFPIYVPPLRERERDISILANHFIRSFSAEKSNLPKISGKDMQRLEGYSWPGNVRELKHVIHRATILTKPGNEWLALPEKFASPFNAVGSAKQEGMQVGRSLSDIEKELIYLTLNTFQGDKNKAAKVLGVSTKTLYNRLNAYEKETNTIDD